MWYTHPSNEADVKEQLKSAQEVRISVPDSLFGAFFDRTAFENVGYEFGWIFWDWNPGIPSISTVHLFISPVGTPWFACTWRMIRGKWIEISESNGESHSDAGTKTYLGRPW